MTRFAFRNPNGITYGYATFDLLLQRLSKLRFPLSSFIFHLSTLTTFAVRNPRGATCSCTTRDPLLQRLSKLSAFIFALCSLTTFAVRNPRGATCSCTTRDPLLQRLSKLSALLFALFSVGFAQVALARHSKSKLFLCTRLLATFSYGCMSFTNRIYCVALFPSVTRS